MTQAQFDRAERSHGLYLFNKAHEDEYDEYDECWQLGYATRMNCEEC